MLLGILPRGVFSSDSALGKMSPNMLRDSGKPCRARVLVQNHLCTQVPEILRQMSLIESARFFDKSIEAVQIH